MSVFLNHQPDDLSVRGILIYPYNGREIAEVYRHDERLTFEVVTINLDARWEELKRELQQIIE